MATPNEENVDDLLKQIKDRKEELLQSTAPTEEDPPPPEPTVSEPIEDTTVRKPGKPLPAALQEQIREMKRQGSSYEDIRDELGVSDNSIAKYTKDIPSKAAHLKTEKKGVKSKGGRGGSPEAYPQKRIYQQITSDITQEALERLELVMATGKPVLDRWQYYADMRGLDLVDYIELSCDFFEAYDGYVSKLERNIQVQAAAIQLLTKKALPHTQREEQVQVYLASCILADQNPDPALVFKLIQRG